MTILQFLKFNKKKNARIILICALLILSYPLLSGLLPMGRDWVRYWHPHLHYFKTVGTSFGVVWQEGGGFLTSYDPSTLAWDPGWQLISRIFSYDTSIAIYLLMYLWIGVICFYLLCARRIDTLLASITAASYACSGLVLSVMHQQFLPIILVAPIAVYTYEKFVEKQNYINLVCSILAFYYVGYSAVPNLVVLCWVFGFISEWKSNKIKNYLIISLYAAVLLIPAYSGLILSKLMGLAPDSTGWYNWSFSIPRVISMIIPEGGFDEPKKIWYSHMFGGDSHKVEPYFRSVLLPFWIFSSWIGYIFTVKSHKNYLAVFAAILIILMSLIGYAPNIIIDTAWHVPFFWSRYPEKFLLLLVPLVFYSAALFINNNLEKPKKIVSSFVLSFVFLGLIFLYNSLKYSGFLMAISLVEKTTWILLLSSIVISVVAITIRTLKLKLALLILASILWAPLSIQQFNSARSKLSYIVTKRSNFLQLHENLMLNSRIYIHPSASVSYCMARSKNVNPFGCSDYDFGAYFLLSTYTNVSAGSFNNYKYIGNDLLENQVANYKPKYLIFSRAVYEPEKVCSLLLNMDSITSCTNVTNAQYGGEIVLLELKHKNNFTILGSSTPGRLDLGLVPAYDAVRVPFFPPPFSEVMVDDKTYKYELDPYGLVVNDLTPGKSYKLSINYGYRIEIYTSIAALVLLLLLTWALKLGKIFPIKSKFI